MSKKIIVIAIICALILVVGIAGATGVVQISTVGGFDELLTRRNCDYLPLQGLTYARCMDDTMWICEQIDPSEMPAIQGQGQ